MRQLFALILLAVVSAGLICPNATAQAVGDWVVLQSSNPDGVPVHPGAGDRHYKRWQNGTVAMVTAVDEPTGWREVLSQGGIGWVITDYMTVVLVKPILSRPRLTAEKVFELTIPTANQGRKLVIEASADMRQWTPVSTNVFSVLQGLVFQESNTDGPRRFYRAVSW